MSHADRLKGGKVAEARRRELGAFLQEKRRSLRPESVGLPPGTRRRTPGLRREEVALLADVSVSWYTWLEQGRDIHPSVGTLTRVLDALRCTSEEGAYVRGLLSGVASPPGDTWDPALQQVLGAFLPAPAVLLDRHWRPVAVNDAARYLDRGGRADVLDGRSLLELMFLDEAVRASVVNWEEEARALVAAFRLDSSRYPDDGWFARQVAALSEASAEFTRLWAERQVRAHGSARTVMRHPEVGELVLNASWLQVMGAPHLKLLVYTVEPGSPTAAVFARLASER
ncbi:helix-turn-helix transcriptional regulator [Deinococcus sp. SDU3-2]|uniref:Helix-turn-helix transcriptional regulator n=1 Tax=Deinococcus terrestris TaxID=2651870 RepID=A0A7X1NW43_9DEIO|nr:helix-turn-helix transcriptional regulator [Deinococcus terrestris]MPY66479.1 helix-turn-helix transcriptional regulator [Deinococcus terrestris]